MRIPLFRLGVRVEMLTGLGDWSCEIGDFDVGCCRVVSARHKPLTTFAITTPAAVILLLALRALSGLRFSSARPFVGRGEFSNLGGFSLFERHVFSWGSEKGVSLQSCLC